MEYSAIHKQFLVSQKDLDSAVSDLKYAMKCARQLAGVSLGKRKNHDLTKLDHLERSIIQASKNFGLNFGAEWGSDIDLSDFE